MQSRHDHARTRARVAIAIAVAFVLGACSQGEPEKTPARPATPAPVASAPADATPPAGGYAPGEALKERLARQEAANRMVDAAPTPPAPKPAAPAKAPEPAKATPSLPAAPVAAAKSPPAKTIEPVVVAAPAPAPPPAPAAKAEPPKVTPPPATRTEVAVAKTAPVAVATRLLQRVEPEFPREALQAGEEKGVVQARLTVDERGSVTRVEVLEAYPRRVFDRSVIRALSQWKYNDGSPGRTVEIEIAFKK